MSQLDSPETFVAVSKITSFLTASSSLDKNHSLGLKYSNGDLLNYGFCSISGRGEISFRGGSMSSLPEK